MTLVLLNNIDHHDLRVRAPAGPRGGAATIQVLTFATEFAELQRHYPIVFRKSVEGVIRPAAILGLAENQNLFTEEGGAWCPGAYIPAAIQRGPFALTRGEDEGVAPQVLIDTEHPSVSREDGEALFRTHGGNSPFLDRIAGILRTIYEGELRADDMIGAFENAGILHPANLQVRTGEDEIYAISDVQIVRSDSLETLSDGALVALHRAGFLTHAVHAASSLANLQRLADRKARLGRADRR